MAENAAHEHSMEPVSTTRVRGISKHPVVYGVLLAYTVISTILMLAHTVGVTSDHVLLIALVLMAIVAPARDFVWDFLPFLSAGVMFSDVGAMVEKSTESAHSMAPILIERTVFGGNVASVWLQQHLSGVASWIDIPLALVYLTFFAAPILFGLWLWLRDREHFGMFVTAYIGMMAVGFLVHVIYPEAPPWLASRDGILPYVDRITVSLLQHLGGIGRLLQARTLRHTVRCRHCTSPCQHSSPQPSSAFVAGIPAAAGCGWRIPSRWPLRRCTSANTMSSIRLPA